MHLLYQFLPWLFFGLFILFFLSFLGLVRFRTVMVAGLVIFFLPFLLPVLPIWAQLILFGLLALAILRAILALFLGIRVADRAIGDFVGYLLRTLVLVFLAPFRTIGWISRAMLHR